MLELLEWAASAPFADKPWLVLGKGPTFDRRAEFDLDAYHLLAMNHAVSEVKVDVAHIIDADVVADCADALRTNCRWLLMPRYPHLRSKACDRTLEDWFDELPVLRELDQQGRLVWYNLSGARPMDRSPVIAAKQFSSEAVFRILGLLGVRQ